MKEEGYKKLSMNTEYEHTHDGYTHTHDGHEHTHEHTHDGHTHSHDDLGAHTHEHSHGGYIHSHEHEHDHGNGHHGHTHSHEHTKSVINRLKRASGHLEAVIRMVEDGRDCPEVLIQLSAVRSALNNTAKVILKDHIEHCIVDAVANNDHEALNELNDAIDSFIK